MKRAALFVESVIERERFALSELATFFSREPATLGRFRSLARRLPRGLVYAEEILCVHGAPLDAEPLAPKSAWFARDRTLITTTSGMKLTALLADLAAYGSIAAELAARANGDPSVPAYLAGEEVEGLALTRAAMVLGCSSEALGRAREEAPELLADLADLLAVPFDPVIHVHPELLPSRTRAAARAAAEDLLERIPGRAFDLVVADTPWMLEHLSPYTRDLGHALHTWGLENGARLRARGLYEALLEARASPSADLSALVARDLLGHEPELLLERRQAERTQGLALWDVDGSTYGFADLSRLAAPDESVLADPREGVTVLLVGADHFVGEAARVLLHSGRALRLAAIAGAASSDHLILPDGLVVEDDAVSLSSAELLDRAARFDVPAAGADHVDVSDPRRTPTWLFDLLAHHRRAALLGLTPAEPGPLVALHPHPDPVELTLGLRALQVARIVLSALFDKATEGPKSRSNPPEVHGRSRITRRFRA